MWGSVREGKGERTWLGLMVMLPRPRHAWERWAPCPESSEGRKPHPLMAWEDQVVSGPPLRLRWRCHCDSEARQAHQAHPASPGPLPGFQGGVRPCLPAVHPYGQCRLGGGSGTVCTQSWAPVTAPQGRRQDTVGLISVQGLEGAPRLSRALRFHRTEAAAHRGWTFTLVLPEHRASPGATFQAG